MGNWINWLLLIVGIVCIIAELVMGALTGFDLALVGTSLAAGGFVGLLAHSEKIGVFSAAVLAVLYFVFIRRWLKSKLHVKEQPSNVDAVVGRTGIVTKRIAPHDAGRVKVGPEEWRAELEQPDAAAKDLGSQVTVVSVEGVTLKVR